MRQRLCTSRANKADWREVDDFPPPRGHLDGMPCSIADIDVNRAITACNTAINGSLRAVEFGHGGNCLHSRLERLGITSALRPFKILMPQKLLEASATDGMGLAASINDDVRICLT